MQVNPRSSERPILTDSPETQLSTTDRIENLDQIIQSQDDLQLRMHPYIVDLMQTRHAEYTVPDTTLDRTQQIAAQLYEDPTYNPTFVHGVDEEGKGGDLDARRGGEFNTAQEYEEGRYSQAILRSAQALGFVAPELPLPPKDPIDLQLGIADSYLEPINRPVEAVIVPTAKSISNPIRIRDAIRNIESGAIKTDHVIIASCDRPVLEDEQQKMQELGLEYGTTEFGSAIAALNQLTDSSIDEAEAEDFEITINGVARNGRTLRRRVDLAGKTVDVTVVSAPFDPTRKIGVKDGQPLFAERANTQENFLAAHSFLSTDPGLVVVVSHDVWVQSQGEVAKQILAPKDKQVIATGPFKMDRLVEDETGTLHLNQPGQVVDEIAKTYAFATKTRVIAETERAKLSGEYVNTEALLQPLPDMRTGLEKKWGYRTLAIDVADPRFSESVVSLDVYGIAGQSYYSRPNATLQEAVPEVPLRPFLRESVARKLAAINQRLDNDEITNFFGGHVELYVEDGVRPVTLQRELFETAIPRIIRQNAPDLPDEEVDARRNDIIAAPVDDTRRPSPHATGGAVDVMLRYRQDTPLYVPDVAVWMGHKDGDTGESITPDYYEHFEPTNESDALARRNRRAFYAIMTGQAFNSGTDLAINPTEIWHWSVGDQLWGAVTDQRPYYGLVEE